MNPFEVHPKMVMYFCEIIVIECISKYVDIVCVCVCNAKIIAYCYFGDAFFEHSFVFYAGFFTWTNCNGIITMHYILCVVVYFYRIDSGQVHILVLSIKFITTQFFLISP